MIRDERTIKLYATNFDVAVENNICLAKNDEEIFRNKSEDMGEVKYLRNHPAAKVLWLKVGCPVIFIKNIDAILVNGLQGQVTKLTSTGPVVQFGNTIVSVKKFLFDIYDPNQGKVLAARSQFPLKLAYALTMHHAQGQTLQRVIMNCSGVTNAGQIGVAVGRAMFTEGLQVINYKRVTASKKHPEQVYWYYDIHSKDFAEDLTCCRIRNEPTDHSTTGNSQRVQPSAEPI